MKPTITLYLFLLFSLQTIQGQIELEDVATQIIETIISDSTEVEQEAWDEGAPADWEDVFRTSDEEGEKSTRYDFQTDRGIPAGKRIGCECMDGTELDETGTGACGGRGGVRYWIYLQEDGTLSPYFTDRHMKHPDPLSPEELENLSANQPKKQAYGRGGSNNWDIFKFASVAIVCMTIMYLANLLFNKKEENELFH